MGSDEGAGLFALDVETCRRVASTTLVSDATCLLTSSNSLCRASWARCKPSNSALDTSGAPFTVYDAPGLRPTALEVEGPAVDSRGGRTILWDARDDGGRPGITTSSSDEK